MQIKHIEINSEWQIRGVAVEDGVYGCETGCEYVTTFVVLADGTKQQVHGDFGAVDREGDETGRELAKRLGVPIVVNGLLSVD